MLITKEELDLRLREKDKEIEQYKQALEDRTRELIEAQTKLAEQQIAADDGYYIYVPVERECINCPKLELETVHPAAVFGSIPIHQCKHIEFCKQIMPNWMRSHTINCGDKDTQT